MIKLFKKLKKNNINDKITNKNIEKIKNNPYHKSEIIKITKYFKKIIDNKDKEIEKRNKLLEYYQNEIFKLNDEATQSIDIKDIDSIDKEINNNNIINNNN